MPIVTVPGANRTTINVPYVTAATAALATQLLQNVYLASAQGTLTISNASDPTTPIPPTGNIGEFNVDVTASAVTVPAGYSFVVENASAAATITGNNSANELFIIGQGGATIDLGTGSGSIAAGGGTNLFSIPTIGGGNFFIASDGTNSSVTQGSGSVTILGGIADTLGVGVTKPTVTSAAANDTIYGSANQGVYINSGGADTYIGGAGTDTVFVNAAGGTYLGGSGTLLFVSSAAASTIIGGTGLGVLFTGTANDVVFQGAGQLLLVADGGAPTIASGANGGALAFGDGDGTQLNLVGYGNGNYLLASTGNETLNAAGASGLNGLVAGSGNTVLQAGAGVTALFAGTGSATMVGGSAYNLFAFAEGQAGGNDVVMGFKSSDVVTLLGYGAAADAAAIANQVNTPASGTAAASTTLTLPDNTKITLVGVASLSASQVYQG